MIKLSIIIFISLLMANSFKFFFSLICDRCDTFTRLDLLFHFITLGQCMKRVRRINKFYVSGFANDR